MVAEMLVMIPLILVGMALDWPWWGSAFAAASLLAGVKWIAKHPNDDVWSWPTAKSVEREAP